MEAGAGGIGALYADTAAMRSRLLSKDSMANAHVAGDHLPMCEPQGAVTRGSERLLLPRFRRTRRACMRSRATCFGEIDRLI